jgi:hypothetical protein
VHNARARNTSDTQTDLQRIIDSTLATPDAGDHAMEGHIPDAALSLTPRVWRHRPIRDQYACGALLIRVQTANENKERWLARAMSPSRKTTRRVGTQRVRDDIANERRMRSQLDIKAFMNAIRIIAIGLIVAGALALMYGGFSYTKDTTAVKLGPLELTVKEKQTVNVPLWLGIASIGAGGLLLALARRKG